VYVINKSSVLKYTLASGFTEAIVPDEMSIEHEHQEIIKNRSVIKIHPFSFANNQISLAYEKVVKVGMNLDLELGYINNNITQNPLINSNNNLFSDYTVRYYNYNYYGSYSYFEPKKIFYSGAYIKPGIKFFLGQDYSIKGLKYAHPLKGRYIKLDLALSLLNFKDVQRVDYVQSAPFPSVPVTTTITTNIGSLSYGGFINYGRQFILGNLFTLEYYVGLGYTAQSNNYSNSSFLKSGNGRNMDDISKRISNYHGFHRTMSGISGTAGIRLGYILPDKKTKEKEKLKQN
jgi:hypothetical protein